MTLLVTTATAGGAGLLFWTHAPSMAHIAIYRFPGNKLSQRADLDGERGMQVENLALFGANAEFETDLIIVGAGPAGMTIAREFFHTSTRILIVESGLIEEDPRFGHLNAVESIGEPTSQAQILRRIQHHGPNAPSWSSESQGFGVRCRVLGGSTHAWVGKSAAFDDTDFAARSWVPHSGWPFELDVLAPYLNRAAEILNLGPNVYDDRLWDILGAKLPEPRLDPEVLRSFFWQFARSRIDKLDVMRFGREFLTFDAANVCVLTNATVTRLRVNLAGSAFEGVEVSTIDGLRSRVRAKAAVLAASGIENPRLLLVSNDVQCNGLGNQHDVVGRFLMDHPGARIGRFDTKDCPSVTERFGFYGLKHSGRVHMYMHGMALSRKIQEREGLLQCAAYMLEERAPDDPWDALKRLLQDRSENVMSDLATMVSSPALLAKGVGRRAIKSDRVPQAIRHFVIETIGRRFPNFAAREFQTRGLPHKLKGLSIDAISEQRPDPNSRITLSCRCDPLGVPMARIDWRIDDDVRRSLIRLGQLIASEIPRIGLPAPSLEDWVLHDQPRAAPLIDMGHIIGTTRMSQDPRRGVVDPNCQVHGVERLYVAGSSVFPTSGHANPTLMILSLAIRLADRIKTDLQSRPAPVEVGAL
jgi:choline dehydrogenase-like flavoprotein